MKRIPHIVRLILSLGLIGGLSEDIFGQPVYFFENINSNHGLSEDDVVAIHQDARGYLWFGTGDGLNRYDGYSFEVFKTDPSDKRTMGGNLIKRIKGDQQGNIWIGLNGGGISRFDTRTKTFQNYQNNLSDPGSLINDKIRDLLVDRRGWVWATTNRGVDLFIPDEKHSRFRHLYTLPKGTSSADSRQLIALGEGKDGSVFVGGNDGLYQIIENARDTTFRLVRVGLEGVNVLVISFDQAGRLMAGGTGGLYIQQAGHFRQVLHSHVESIGAGPSNQMWVGHTEGISVFGGSKAGDSLTFHHEIVLNDTRFGLPAIKQILSVMMDKTGIVWIGTVGSGIVKYDPNRKKFRHIKAGELPGNLSYKIVRVFFEDSNGTLWVGTRGGGLNYLLHRDDDGTYSKFGLIDQIKNPVSFAEVQSGGRKYLHVGSSEQQGLFTIDITEPQKGFPLREVPELHRSVFTILKDRAGQIWYGTYSSGIFRRRSNGQLDNYTEGPGSGLLSNTIRKLFQDRAGNIWAGTTDGLCFLNASQITSADPHFEVYRRQAGDSTSLPYNYVLPIFEDDRGRIWVGTAGAGLCRFVPARASGKGHFKTYSERDGLSGNVVKAITDDQYGFLWVSTNNGLCRFDPATGKFKRYDVTDGLQANKFQEMACLKRRNGELLFGGINGFNAFRPEQIHSNRMPPVAVLTTFSVWNRVVNPGERFNNHVILTADISTNPDIKLRYDENSFSFKFSALHFSAPSKNRFAYRLVGFDKRWVLTRPGRHFASYTGLPPGEYSFEVKASNNDGLWAPGICRVRVVIDPPAWKSLFAYIVYGLFLSGLVYAYERYKVVRIHEKHQLVMDLRERQRDEELYRMRAQFLTGIAHEIRTPLNLISGPLHYLSENELRFSPEQRQKQYQLMQKSVAFLSELMTQLLNFKKLEQGQVPLEVRSADLAAYCRGIVNTFDFQAGKKGIVISFEASEEPLLSVYSPDAIQKILHNLLYNALKFTPPGGQIRVKTEKIAVVPKMGLWYQAYQKSSIVRIIVSDTGPGILPKDGNLIFEQFFQGADNGSNDEGIGMGLALCRNLSHLHHGRIFVDKTYHHGACLVVEIPGDAQFYANDHWIADTPGQPEEQNRARVTGTGLSPAQDERNLGELASQQPQKLVLLVEDNPDMRAFIRHGLGDEFVVIEAPDGESGLEKLEDFTPMVIITDIKMPVMGGIEFANLVKSRKNLRHIPVIFLTGSTGDDSLIEALKTGADDYITKPFTIELLRIKLRNMQASRQMLRQHLRKEMTTEPREMETVSSDELFLSEAMAIIEKNMMDTDFNVEAMVREMGMSRSNLYARFKDLTDLSIGEFIRSIRLKRASQLLETSDLSIKEIVYTVGFNTASYFSKCFKRQYGMMPKDYRQGNSEKVSIGD